MSFLIRASLAAAAGAAALAAPAEAQAPSKFRLNLGYDGKLLVKVLDINVVQQADDNGFASTVSMRSYGVLSAFKKIQQTARANGRIDAGVARPGVFSQKNIDGADTRAVRVTWTGGDVVTSAQPAYKNMGHPPATRAQRLESIDPVTALLRVSLTDRQAQLCTGVWKFFDGKRRYDLVFSGRATSAPNAREARLGLINPVRCKVAYREVAGFKRKKEKNQGIRRPFDVAFAQAGRGGPWVISSLTGHTPLGSAVIELASVSATGNTPEG